MVLEFAPGPVDRVRLAFEYDLLRSRINQLKRSRQRRSSHSHGDLGISRPIAGLINSHIHIVSRDHVCHGKEQRERAMKSLEIVGLAKRFDHHPNQLSGGQQQRVAIARALVNQPALLLADEPTGNLDSQTSIEIMGVFQKLNDQGITIVMVTHELDIASYTKRNIIMRDGKVVTDEAVKNRLIAENELRKLREAQEASLAVVHAGSGNRAPESGPVLPNQPAIDGEAKTKSGCRVVISGLPQGTEIALVDPTARTTTTASPSAPTVPAGGGPR